MQAESPEPKIARQEDRRRYHRYRVSGFLTFTANDEKEFGGNIIDIGLGGVQFMADPAPTEGTLGTLQMNVDRCEDAIQLESRIVRTDGNAAVAIFLRSSAALVRCIAFLERQAAAR